MRHLKKFNESNNNKRFFTQEEFDDIKDLLRDFMDEYHLELYCCWNGEDDPAYEEEEFDDEVDFIDLMFLSGSGYAADITQCDSIRVLFHKEWARSFGSDDTRNYKFDADIVNLKDRLIQMGYDISNRGLDYYFFIWFDDAKKETKE